MAKFVVDSEEVCTIEEAGALLGKSEVTIWRWIRDEKILAVRIGGRTLIPEQEIERLQKGNSYETS